MSAALRQVLRQVQQEAPQLSRSLRTTTGPRLHYDYEHGPHYLNFQDMPGRRWKVGAFIIGMITTGVGVPAFAVWWHQAKARGS